MSRSIRSSRRDLVTAISLALLSSAAAAQSGSTGALEEIVVTAQKRAESLSDVPIAISAVSAAKMQDAGINNFEGLKNYVPSFFMVPNATGNSIAIRGVFSGTNNGFEQSVGTYVDGLYHGRGQQSRAPFLDLERVEVLRGPQSILFGKNSVAGALNITTARPTDKLEGSVSALYEPEYEEQIYTGMLSGPFTERLRGRVAARYRDFGGNVENLTRSRDEAQQEESSVRGWLEFDLTDNVQLAFKAQHDEFDVTGRAYEIVKELPATSGATAGMTYTQILHAVFGQDASVTNNVADGKRTANANDFSNNNMDEYGFYVDWQLGDHKLTAITGYSKYDFSENADADFTGAPILEQSIDENFKQWSQEIRLASPTGKTFEYLAGLYWEKTELRALTKFPIYANSLLVPIVGAAGPLLANTDSPRDFTQDSDSYAAFVHASWNITDAFRTNVGLRYTSEDKDAKRTLVFTDLNGVPLTGTRLAVVSAVNAALLGKRATNLKGSRSEDHVLPSVGLQYDFTNDVMGYASWTRGAKAGGYDSNSNSPPPFGSFEYDSEKAENYEIGTKMVLGGKFELNLAAYYTEFKDMQVSAFDGTSFKVTNAGAAQIQGLELDSRWQATPNLLISAAVAHTDFEFTDYIGACYTQQPIEIPATPPATGGACDLSGKKNQFVADWTASASADYRIPLGAYELRGVLDAYYTGDYFVSTTLDPKQVQDAYVKLNARLQFGDADGRWEIALLGKNLTDKLIMPYGADVPLASSIARGGFSAVRFVEPGRSVAVQGTFRF
jgi:outer membrane receptor protein involved in Fe transport